MVVRRHGDRSHHRLPQKSIISTDMDLLQSKLSVDICVALFSCIHF